MNFPLLQDWICNDNCKQGVVISNYSESITLYFHKHFKGLYLNVINSSNYHFDKEKSDKIKLA